jgi:hypothetical protein
MIEHPWREKSTVAHANRPLHSRLSENDDLAAFNEHGRKMIECSAGCPFFLHRPFEETKVYRATQDSERRQTRIARQKAAGSVLPLPTISAPR